MRDERTDVLIVGAGLAGARSAEALRALGFDGRIVVLGDEPHTPYERPALSKAALTKGHGHDDLRLRPDAFWLARGIELEPGRRVEQLDLDARVATAGDRRVRFRWLTLATGLRARRLAAVPDGPGVHSLRSLADAVALRRELIAGVRLLVIGAGFVGLEVASSAIALGAAVTVVEPAPTPFAASLGPAVGALLGDRARAAGVQLLLGRSVAGVERDAAGRLVAAVLDDGTRCRCNVVLVGVGAVPNTELVQGRLALTADGGIESDPAGRTAIPGVYACGDVASARREDADRPLRLEHWSAAAASARAVASAIVEAPVPPAGPPFFWSDQFGLRLQAVGLPSGRLDVELDEQDHGLVARYRDEHGRLVGAVTLNVPQALAPLRLELTRAQAWLPAA